MVQVGSHKRVLQLGPSQSCTLAHSVDLVGGAAHISWPRSTRLCSMHHTTRLELPRKEGRRGRREGNEGACCGRGPSSWQRQQAPAREAGREERLRCQPGQLMLHRQRLPAAQPGRRGDAPGCTAGAKDDTGRAAAGPATAGSFCLHACLAHDLPAWAPPLQQTRPAHDPARLSGPFAGRGHPWTSDAARRCAPT